LAAVLLHDVFLVDTLNEAHAQAKYASPSARFVTGTGEWVDGRGLLYGGSVEAGASTMTGRIGRREQLEASRALHSD
ncbi:MAG: hypothetical protein R3268_08570, partial [Acidiferrobacterales bacterium]|nr:hypothetical protein [Acidiferrobacterales bacterium]